MRREVLGGKARVVLAGMRERTKTAARPRMVRYAQSLGGVVREEVEDGRKRKKDRGKTAFVVASATNEENHKVQEGKAVVGCAVVRPAWIMECVWSLTRRDVKDHLMAAVKESPEGGTDSAENSAESSDSSEGDSEGSSSEEDFADMLD
uniref:BRCT domain-containing protein n=1 Tax=Corethron hystrix TaxID=216773 RepID=A0A7S1G0Q0_9STRA